MGKDLKYNFPKYNNQDWLNTIGKELKQNLKKFPEFEWELGLSIAVNGTTEKIERGGPGKFPFVAGWNKNENSWSINQSFTNSNNNKQILEALSHDVSSITLQGNINEKDLNTLFSKVLPQYIETHFLGNENSIEFLNSWKKWLNDNKIEPKEIQTFLGFDPLANGKINSFDTLYPFVSEGKKYFSQARPLAVNGMYYEASGATLAQRLAYTLAHAVEYLNELVNKGMSIDDASASVAVYFPISNSFLHEISALRAFKILWANAVKAFEPKHDCSNTIYIQAVLSDSYWSVYDEYNNLIRATVQAMSAIIGGCNSLSVTPFNSPSQKQNDFSLRLARNIQHILKNESYLDKVVDPSAGSFYIEAVTEVLCTSAWKIFLEIENKGGFKSFLKSGELTNELNTSAELRRKRLAEGKHPIIGLNKFLNKNEKIENLGSTRLVSELEKSIFKKEGIEK